MKINKLVLFLEQCLASGSFYLLYELLYFEKCIISCLQIIIVFYISLYSQKWKLNKLLFPGKHTIQARKSKFREVVTN